jgi:hypothetical protein
MGKRGSNDLQGGETELCVRLRETTDSGVIYTPEAVVTHKVFEHRTKLRWLIRRAFWQGASKRGMQVTSDANLGSEYDFLRLVLRRSMPERLWGLFTGPRLRSLMQLVFLVFATAAVGLGYAWGFARFRTDGHG